MNNVAKKISLLALALPTLVACVAEPRDADPTGSDAAALHTNPGAAGRATQAENDCVDGVYRGKDRGYWKAGVTFQCKLGGGIGDSGSACQDAVLDYGYALACAGHPSPTIDMNSCDAYTGDGSSCADVGFETEAYCNDNFEGDEEHRDATCDWAGATAECLCDRACGGKCSLSN